MVESRMVQVLAGHARERQLREEREMSEAAMVEIRRDWNDGVRGSPMADKYLLRHIEQIWGRVRSQKGDLSALGLLCMGHFLERYK